MELPFKDELGIPLTGMGSRIHLPGKKKQKKSRGIPLTAGVLTDIPKESLTAIGWELHYDQEYKHSTPKDILDSLPEDSAYVLLGAQRSDSPDVINRAAMGLRKVVCKETKGNNTTAHNGLFFYHCKGQSMGFSAVEEINLCKADTASSSAESRLSWHISNSGSGGWRAGGCRP